MESLKDEERSDEITSQDEETEAGILSTQDLINHIAEHNVAATKEPIVPISPSDTPPSSDIVASDVTEIQKIIAEFCVDAPCNKVREVLRLYSPDNSYVKQMSIFNSSRCKKSDLIKTLQFLGVSNVSWKDQKKKDCAHKLHYRIQNLMPEECGVCKEMYVVKKNDPCLLSCSICGHEVHHKCYESLFKKNNDGSSVVETMKMVRGFHHLCPSCEDDIIPDDKLPTSKSSCCSKTATTVATTKAEPKTTPPPTTAAPVTPKTTPPKTPTVPTAAEDSTTTEQQQQQQSGESSSFSSPPVDEGDTSQSSEGDLQNEQKNLETKTQTCKHYKNNKCRFGISGKDCPFLHPKRCSKLMNHGTRANKGCNKGNKCKDFHPKMCPLSISKSECFDASCTLCHVKGTKRHPPKPKVDPKEIAQSKNEVNQKADSSRYKVHHKDDSSMDSSIDRNLAESQSPTTPTVIDNASFLEQISLLKKELQEAMDRKLESLIQMQSQQIPQQIPPRPTHQIPTPLFAPIPWMHQFQMQRNPPFQMGY